MNYIAQIITLILPAFDVVASILVTLYISVAIFAAQNLFKQIPDHEISVSGKSYLKVLYLVKISLLLISIPILVRIGTIDVFTEDYGNLKAFFLLILLIGITFIILNDIFGIITQKHLNRDKRIEAITTPSLKSVAWLILNTDDWLPEKRDLMAGSLASTNKSNLKFEELLIEELIRQTDQLTSSKNKDRDQSDYIISLVNTLKDNLHNKPLGFPPYIDQVFQYLFMNWLKISNDTELYKTGGIYNLRLAFMNGFNTLSSYCLKNGLAYDFFKNFKEFVDTLDEDVLEKFLLSFDDKILFEEIPSSPENSFIWSDFFPEEWKFTHKNLVEDRNIIAMHLYNHFLRWAQNRLLDGKSVDKELDNFTDNMFPEVDPIIWARILEYKYAPYVDDNHVAYVVSKTGNFGLGKSYAVQDWTDDEKIYWERIQKEDEEQMLATVKLTNGLVMFSKKHLEDALKEVAQLEKDKSLSDREKRKLAQHKIIFTRLLDDIKQRIALENKNKSKN